MFSVTTLHESLISPFVGPLCRVEFRFITFHKVYVTNPHFRRNQLKYVFPVRDFTISKRPACHVSMYQFNSNNNEYSDLWLLCVV
jgi:hypothetical protein